MEDTWGRQQWDKLVQSALEAQSLTGQEKQKSGLSWKDVFLRHVTSIQQLLATTSVAGRLMQEGRYKTIIDRSARIQIALVQHSNDLNEVEVRMFLDGFRTLLATDWRLKASHTEIAQHA